MVYTVLNPIISSASEFAADSYLTGLYPDYNAYLTAMNIQYDNATSVQCDFTYLIQDTPSSNGISGTWLDMEPCTKAHFSNFDGIIDSNTERLIEDSYCLPMQSYGLVYGFSLSVYCPSQSNLTSFLNQNPSVQVYYPKYGLSLQNYTHPIQPYLYNYEIQMKPATSGTTYSYWSLNYLDITTDRGWLTTSEKTDNYVQVAPTVNPEVTISSQQVKNVFIFELSKEEIFYTRTYTKLQDVLADVGGLAGTVLAVLLILTTPFARVKLGEAFVNEMFESRTENESKKKSKKKSKRTNTAKVSNRSSFDGSATQKYNLQILEMAERNIKDPSVETIPMKSQHYEIHNDESPLVNAEIRAEPQPFQAEGVIIPRAVKKSFVEFDELPVQPPVQTIRPNQIKGGFESKNPFNGDQNKNTGIEVQDLENPEIIPELSPIETPSKSEGGGEEEQIREKGDIEAQQDYVRNANQVIAEDQSRKLQKDGVFETMQLSLPAKPKKIKKPKIIHITFFEYLTSFVYKSESTRKKIKILYRGLDMLESRLDVFNLLKKMRDTDKMKGLIFDKDELYLFDRLPRPDIKDPSAHWYQEEYLSYYETLTGTNELEELKVKAHIKESKRTLENKPEKSQVNERILRLI